MEFRSIQRGSDGELVKVWQTFLRGTGHYAKLIDGDFGPATAEATRAFERSNGIAQDGVVDDFLWNIALGHGLEPDGLRGALWPKKPDTMTPLGQLGRQELFGEIRYRHTPIAGNPEHVTIVNDWIERHIVNVQVPQLAKLREQHGARMGWPKDGLVAWHREGEANLLGFWQYVEEAALLDRLLSFGGTWSPRLVRGGQSLSNHAHAVAFDVNVPWNWMGRLPAPVGAIGSVLELVDIAAAWGFYWGGWFRRVDGMHFELCDPTARPNMDATWYTEAFRRRV